MAQPVKKPGSNRSKWGSDSGTGRKIGYIAAIVVMFVILYLLRHLRDWNVNFLNENYEKCLFYIELSIYATIGANVLFIFYDNRWFKHLLQAVTNVFGALSLIKIYVLFPFNLDETWSKWVDIGLLIAFGLTVIGVIFELVKGIRDLVKNPEVV